MSSSESPASTPPSQSSSGRPAASPSTTPSATSFAVPARIPPLERQALSAYRFSAFLVLLLGLWIGGSGMVLQKVGSLGAQRYEKASGKLMRMLSTEDTSNYGSLRSAVIAGGIIKYAGLATLILSLAFLVYPYPLYWVHYHVTHPRLKIFPWMKRYLRAHGSGPKDSQN